MSATRALAQTLGRAAGSPVRVGDRRASDRRHDERRASRLSEREQGPRQGAPIGPPHGGFVRRYSAERAVARQAAAGDRVDVGGDAGVRAPPPAPSGESICWAAVTGRSEDRRSPRRRQAARLTVLGSPRARRRWSGERRERAQGRRWPATTAFALDYTRVPTAAWILWRVVLRAVVDSIRRADSPAGEHLAAGVSPRKSPC